MKAPRVRPTSGSSVRDEQVLEKLDELAQAGVTEFAAAMAGEANDRDETFDTLLEYQSRK